MENNNKNIENINNITICINKCNKCSDLNCFEYPCDITCENLKCNYFYTSCIKQCNIIKLKKII